MTGAQDTHHILLSLSVHLYQSLSISPPILPPRLSPPSFHIICRSSQLPRSFALHPCVSPLPATFIYRSQLSVHSTPPLSLPPHHPLWYTKTQSYAHSCTHIQRLKHTSGWYRLLQTPAVPLQLISFLLITITAGASLTNTSTSTSALFHSILFESVTSHQLFLPCYFLCVIYSECGYVHTAH